MKEQQNSCLKCLKEKANFARFSGLHLIFELFKKVFVAGNLATHVVTNS